MNPMDQDSEREALRAAVADAVQAPSIFNTQPWQWRRQGHTLELLADPTRRLGVVDPDGHMLVQSCGAALHHARVSLAARGWSADVTRVPADGEEQALARMRLLGRSDPERGAVALREAIARRRTDRRPFSDETVPPDVLAALSAAASEEGTSLHRVRLDQMPMLAVAVAAAATEELADSRYRIELIQWTNRPEWSNDGVPVETAVRRAPRRVGVREFALFPEQGMPVTPGGDRGASYLVLHGPGEERLDWLRAGEALSAVLLTAVSLGLAVAPFSDVLEVSHPRDLVQGLLPGLSCPYVLIRCGYSVDEPVPASPRRSLAEVLFEPMDGTVAPTPGQVAG